MANWPVNPIGNLYGESYSSLLGGIGTECSAGFSVAGNTQQTVSHVNIVFSIGLEYYDHTTFSNVCHFSAELFKQTATGVWQSVDYEFKYLPQDQKARNGHWYDTLEVSVTMTDPVENYRLHIHDDIPAGIFHTSEDAYINLQAIQAVGVIGDFTLDFVPLSIVYCPPGQDMTNSLSQTLTFGTKFTIGNSSTFQSDTSQSLKVDFLGIFGEGIGFSNSQSVSNQSTSGIQVSHFKNTVVTADNQRAIGRAYWGPLNDIFVIMVNPNFQVIQRADALFYCLNGVEQLIVVPARKLLRPDGDPIANAIPADSRQRLLQLDPFLTNLNLFFPDSGADLAVAADPFADPSANNRASIIGRWWIDTGTEINYSIGETVQLFTNVTNQVNYQSGVTINASAGVNYDGISAALGIGAGTTTTVGLQSSSENDGGYAYNAACFLIRNQNDRDLDGIQVYFDKIFSTFMFQRLNAQEIQGGGPGGTAITGTTGTAPTATTGTTGTAPTATTGTAGTTGTQPAPGGMMKAIPPRPRGRGFLSGLVTNLEGTLLRGLQVYLTGSDGSTHQTSTSATGKYSFANLAVGDYTLVAGDQRRNVTISPECSPVKPERLDATNVRRVLDLRTAAVWEVADALGLSSDAVRNLGSQLEQIKNEEHVAKAAGADPVMLARWKRAVVFAWPGVPGLHAQAAPPRSKTPKPPPRDRGRDGKPRPPHGRRRK